MAEPYVSGLDLSTGRVVQPDEREVYEWRDKGHNGDGTLVCLECYHGADSPDSKPRRVPLVPKGRIGGVRRRHFAHPPGMAPVGGHSPETAWHWEVKHRLRQWAQESAGVSALVEAWTADGRRRSDIAVTFPEGSRLALEVQLSQMTDAELLARRQDYARLGSALVWVWSSDDRVPHVLFQFGEPGWVFDRAGDQMGLVCGQAQSRGQPPRPHLALRIDGRPPWSHPLTRLYWCPRCDFLTGGQLQSSPVPHEIPGPDRWITRADLEPDA